MKTQCVESYSAKEREWKVNVMNLTPPNHRQVDRRQGNPHRRIHGNTRVAQVSTTLSLFIIDAWVNDVVHGYYKSLGYLFVKVHQKMICSEKTCWKEILIDPYKRSPIMSKDPKVIVFSLLVLLNLRTFWTIWYW